MEDFKKTFRVFFITLQKPPDWPWQGLPEVKMPYLPV